MKRPLPIKLEDETYNQLENMFDLNGRKHQYFRYNIDSPKPEILDKVIKSIYPVLEKLQYAVTVGLYTRNSNFHWEPIKDQITLRTIINLNQDEIYVSGQKQLFLPKNHYISLFEKSTLCVDSNKRPGYKPLNYKRITLVYDLVPSLGDLGNLGDLGEDQGL